MPVRKRPAATSDLTERLQRHLEVLGLTHTGERLEEHLAWATKEKPAPGSLLERVLGEEAAFKLERRIERRIDLSGLPERKTLEAFDWAFQPGLDKAFLLDLAGLASTSSAARRTSSLPARAVPARATSSKPSECAPAKRSSPSATLAASTSSTTSTLASLTLLTNNGSSAGPLPTS